MHQLILQTNPQWHEILEIAIAQLNPEYIHELMNTSDWLPGPTRLFAAFTQPLSQINYVLLGESPYPRPESANGYAFWDEAVGELWSPTGLSKAVNRATSLRNWIKMMLLARGDLQEDTSQSAIALLEKSRYWQTGHEFFTALLRHGFLLLNASLVYRANRVIEDARAWRPFLDSVLNQLIEKKPEIQCILFGRIAAQIEVTQKAAGLIAEHPYNLSFITNPNVLQFFKPLDLLRRDDLT